MATTTHRAMGAPTNPAGPLTAVWTPDSRCADGELYRVAGCYPIPTYPLPPLPYFSPGVCPSGMTSAMAGNGGIGDPIKETETAALCCRTGYDYGDVVTFNGNVNRYCTKTMDGEGEETDVATMSHMVVEVRWAESDLSVLAIDPTGGGSLAVSSMVGLETAAAEAEATSTNTIEAEPHRLRPREVMGGLEIRDFCGLAGVFIAAAVVLLGLGALVLMAHVRRTRRRVRNAPPCGENSEETGYVWSVDEKEGSKRLLCHT